MPKSPTLIRFEAFFDEEAGVWVAHSDNGQITTESPTASGLVQRLKSLVPDVLEERNGRRPRDVGVVISWRGNDPESRAELMVA